MKIAFGTNRVNQSDSPPFSPFNKLGAPDVVAANMAVFAEKILGWMLEDKQREFLTGPSKRVILNCTRQWGKSWMAAMALLFHALHHPDLLSLVARPTLRKSAELLKKVKDLTSRIGLSIKGEFVAGFPVSQCSHLRSQALKSIVSIGGLHRHCGASISAQNLPLATKRTGRCGVGLTNSGDSQVVR